MTNDQPRSAQNRLHEYGRVLRRRKLILGLPIILVPLVAVIASLNQTPLHQSIADVLLNRQDLANSLTGATDSTLNQPDDRIVQTQADAARSPVIARRVLQGTGVRISSREFLSRSTVSPKPASDVLTFSVTDPDAATAKRLANAYAANYIRFRRELDTSGPKQAIREVSARISELQAESGASEKGLIESLAEKRQELGTLAALQTSKASLIGRAESSTRTQPRPLRDAVLGLGIGILLGVGLAFARDALDTRVRTEDEVEDELNLPLLGRLPPPPAAADGRTQELFMVTEPTGLEAQAFSMLCVAIELSEADRANRVIVVTSALAEEGKSTTAANLAIAYARRGRRVTLIDCDFRRPAIARLFGLPSRVGFTNVVRGAVPLPEALADIHVGATEPADPTSQAGRLRVLTTGPPPPSPSDFLSLDSVTALIAEVGEDCDLVILDTPPALAASDAVALSSTSDAFLLVARMNVVRRPALRELARLLDTDRVRCLGFVATGVAVDVGYGYGYYGNVDLARDDEAPELRSERSPEVVS